MSDHEVHLLFEKRLNDLILAYKESDMAVEPKSSVYQELSKNDDSFNVPMVI